MVMDLHVFSHFFSLLIFVGFSSSSDIFTFSHLSNSTVNAYLNTNAASLLISNGIRRLSSSSIELLSSIDDLFSSNDVDSVVFTWNTGDCVYPRAIATYHSNKFIVSPICFTGRSSSSRNFVQLTVTTEQLAQAASAFMSQHSLTYFTMIYSSSDEFYSNLALQFNGHLSKNTFTHERSFLTSNFSATTLSGSRSRSEYETNGFRASVIS